MADVEPTPSDIEKLLTDIRNGRTFKRHDFRSQKLTVTICHLEGNGEIRLAKIDGDTWHYVATFS